MEEEVHENRSHDLCAAVEALEDLEKIGEENVAVRAVASDGAEGRTLDNTREAQDSLRCKVSRVMA